MGDGYENGLHVQTVDPDMAAEIDEARIAELKAELAELEADKPFQPLTIEEALQSRAEAMRWFLVECWLPENGSSQRRRCKEAAIRFTALSVLLRPALFTGERFSYQTLAKELECSRAELSKVALKFSDKADLQFRGQRNKTTRARNAKARIKHHSETREQRNGFVRAFIDRFSIAFKRA
jgi:hypothetical protein